MATDRGAQTGRFGEIITQTVLKGELSDFCLEQEANFNPVSKAVNIVFLTQGIVCALQTRRRRRLEAYRSPTLHFKIHSVRL